MPRQSHATKLKNAKASLTGANAAQIEQMEQELAELQARQIKQLEALKAQSGLEEWRKINDIREKMLAEIENVTSMSVDTALTVPEWFEFVDPDNKKKKSATEDADWIQEKLSGKNADQKTKLLDELRAAAEEQRIAVWSRFNRKLRRKSATSKTKSDATPKPTPSATVSSSRKVS